MRPHMRHAWGSGSRVDRAPPDVGDGPSLLSFVSESVADIRPQHSPVHTLTPATDGGRRGEGSVSKTGRDPNKTR
jgi:hypothetical protein